MLDELNSQALSRLRSVDIIHQDKNSHGITQVDVEWLGFNVHAQQLCICVRLPCKYWPSNLIATTADARNGYMKALWSQQLCRYDMLITTFSQLCGLLRALGFT